MTRRWPCFPNLARALHALLSCRERTIKPAPRSLRAPRLQKAPPTARPSATTPLHVRRFRSRRRRLPRLRTVRSIRLPRKLPAVRQNFRRRPGQAHRELAGAAGSGGFGTSLAMAGAMPGRAKLAAGPNPDPNLPAIGPAAKLPSGFSGAAPAQFRRPPLVSRPPERLAVSRASLVRRRPPILPRPVPRVSESRVPGRTRRTRSRRRVRCGTSLRGTASVGHPGPR